MVYDVSKARKWSIAGTHNLPDCVSCHDLKVLSELEPYRWAQKRVFRFLARNIKFYRRSWRPQDVVHWHSVVLALLRESFIVVSKGLGRGSKQIFYVETEGCRALWGCYQILQVVRHNKVLTLKKLRSCFYVDTNTRRRTCTIYLFWGPEKDVYGCHWHSKK